MFHHDTLFIGGSWATPATDVTDTILNPATEEVIGTVPVASTADADAAIAVARKAFDEGPWPSMRPAERQGYLRRLHDALRARAAVLEDLVVGESGVARARARALHIDTTMDHLAFFTEMAGRTFTEPLMPMVRPRPGGRSVLGSSVQYRQPVGVVSAIVPYNAPFLVSIAKVAPALGMGNTVVLKPSPLSPLQTFVLAEAIEEAGFPPGVFNLLTGESDVGELLSSDERIDLVSFTGSEPVGAAVLAQAARTIKKVLLELGGKSALIIREDAEMDRAVQAGLASLVNQAGQGCSITTRHLVHRSVVDEYVASLTAAAGKVRIGDPSDLDIDMGPLIRERQRERVEYFVETGRAEGAELVCGGRRPGHLSKGYFYEPTVFAGVDNASVIAQEEIFGPVASVITYETDDQAAEIANNSRFGLGGQIFSRDSGSAFELARRIRTGQVGINGGAGGMSSYAPFGGMKRSGLGREYGEQGVLEFTEIQAISFNAG
ncbi:MAG TPA: aldehyde dehydrogenase family protein [Amycolatopsis sp.]|nr:aldehyde dehydrogenase family protein [Amycolatopsis sp.]